MRTVRILLLGTTTAAVLAGLVVLRFQAVRAQTPKIVWIDALCGANPVNRNLHDRLNALAGRRNWETRPSGAGCEWATGDQRADAVDRALTGNAQTIGGHIRANSRDATLVVLTNSMVAARLGDLRPGVVNPRLITRELYLFSTDPDVLCRQTSKLRVGYLGVARRAEIVNTIARENTRRAVSDIDAREFPTPSSLADLLGASAGGLEIVALVTDDLGGAYDTFKRQVVDRRPGAIKAVSRCTTTAEQGPPRIERSLDGSVSYLTIGTPPSASATAGSTAPVPLVALLRPGEEPEMAPQKGWFARATDSVSRRVQAAGVRPSDFRDFPVVLAIGPQAAELAADPELKQTLSHGYFEGMFDSFTAGLSPCRGRADALFGLYLINSYLEDRGSVEKGCALEAYYELVSPTEDKRPPTLKKNIDILKADSGLAACLNRNPPAPAAALVCKPDEKRKIATRDYPHYAYYELGLEALEAARSQAGPTREQLLQKAETCLRLALAAQPQPTCKQFTQGLFTKPYEPSLPLGAVSLKSGK